MSKLTFGVVLFVVVVNVFIGGVATGIRLHSESHPAVAVAAPVPPVVLPPPPRHRMPIARAPAQPHTPTSASDVVGFITTHGWGAHCIDFDGYKKMLLPNWGDPDCQRGWTPRRDAATIQVVAWRQTNVGIGHGVQDTMPSTNPLTDKEEFIRECNEIGGHAEISKTAGWMCEVPPSQLIYDIRPRPAHSCGEEDCDVPAMRLPNKVNHVQLYVSGDEARAAVEGFQEQCRLDGGHAKGGECSMPEWGCADKSRILMTAEDGKHWCHKPQTD
jgi:hypothetical protein